MIIGLIPARYNSSRLPGKPLLKFKDKTMIQMVYEQTLKSKYIDKVYVVTDDERIKQNIDKINGQVLMVTEKCLNGTERIILAIKKNRELFLKAKYIVNIQGDEPFIDPQHIDSAAQKMITNIDNSVKCWTLHYLINKQEDLHNTSIGKIVLDKNNNILYCSRNCIPSNKSQQYDLSMHNYYGHIGLFVFDIDYLKNEFMTQNTPLQLSEDIEWLKIIEQGYKIVSSQVKNYEIGVNTLNDYDYLIRKYY